MFLGKISIKGGTTQHSAVLGYIYFSAYKKSNKNTQRPEVFRMLLKFKFNVTK